MMPGYGSATPIEAIDASVLTEAQFRREFVARNRPCRIVGAVRHWRAFEHWRSPDYLMAHTPPDGQVQVRSVPIAESSALASKALRPRLLEYNKSIFKEMSFHDYLRDLEQKDDSIVVRWQPIRKTGMYSKLHGDIGSYPFIPVLGRSRYYPKYRTFFFRRSYTDWHFHPADEALMTQIASSKEVLLLPPDQGTWNMLAPLLNENMHVYERYADLGERLRAKNQLPYRALVQAGDALYIPAFWWHAVASVGSTFGSTLIATFKTPQQIQGNLRFPGLRSLYRHAIESRAVPGTQSFYRILPLLATLPYAEGHHFLQTIKRAFGAAAADSSPWQDRGAGS